MEGYKTGSLLKFERAGKEIFFDLADNSFKKKTKSGEFRFIKNGQPFFRGLSYYDVADSFNNDVYSRYIKLVGNGCSRLTNFGSVFGNIEKYSHLESYLASGINVTYNSFKQPLSNFPKSIIQFMKDSGINFDKINAKKMENTFKAYPKEMENICRYVNEKYRMDVSVYSWVVSILFDVGYYNIGSDWFNLIEEPKEHCYRQGKEDDSSYNQKRFIVRKVGFNCEYKTLFDYLIKITRTEAVRFHEALCLYRDYITMAREMHRNKIINTLMAENPTFTLEDANHLTDYQGLGRAEKYPTYLKVRHDIMSSNYSAWSSVCDEKEFKKRVVSQFAYSYRGYSILTPSSSMDVKKEGSDLNHCVASYVSTILDGTCQIVFMRSRDQENESLLTVEIRNDTIVQVRGENNREPISREVDWLKVYAKAKNLNYQNVRRDAKQATPPIVALVKYDSYIAGLRA